MVGRLAVSLRSRACVVLSLNLDLLLRLQPQMATAPNGFSPKWLQPQMTSAPNDFSPKWLQSQMASAPNGYTHERLESPVTRAAAHCLGQTSQLCLRRSFGGTVAGPA